MKKIVFVLLVVCLHVSVSFAADENVSTGKGYFFQVAKSIQLFSENAPCGSMLGYWEMKKNTKIFFNGKEVTPQGLRGKLVEVEAHVGRMTATFNVREVKEDDFDPEDMPKVIGPCWRDTTE